MNKKYINIGIILSLFVLLFTACDDDYEAPGSDVNHAFITTSFGNKTNRTQINNRVNLMDFSKGVKSRTWTFGDNVVDLDYNPIASSTEEYPKIRFTTPGQHSVILTQTYNGNVWIGETETSSASYDTTITITVVDSIRADFSAVRVQEGTTLTNAEGALNVIEGGREISFTDLSTGEPNDLKWILSRPDGFRREVTEAPYTTKLNSVGNYDVTYIASSDFGKDTLAFKDYIKIIPSTDPMILESITADKKIRLTYSRDVEYPAYCDPASITLNITNDGNPVSGITVTGFSLDANMPNIIILSLSNEIYNTDEITISYDDAVGNLVSADGMKIDSFTDEAVTFTTRKDLFEVTGFDGTVENSTNYNWAYAWWGGEWGKYNIGNNVSTAEVYEGTQSLYFDMQTNGGAILNFRNDAGTNLNTVPVEAGKLYEGSFWIYIEEQGTEASNLLWMLPNNGWATMMGVYLGGTETTGEWYKVSTRYEATATEDLSFVIRGHNPTATGPLKIYIDNMKFEELERRP
ncbi:hypothetical protein [Saccharicrinis sp. 156]|uniref:hypothetical protein n=1 Tax=Saccharicrinis sp. 156 TaxID=3417574 RepID=UPI003D333858